MREARAVKDAFAPVSKQTLSETLVKHIRGLIRAGEYRAGDRLPPIMEMARRFGVGHPTVREAMKKLETMRLVQIRHGSGVYVSATQERLVFAGPDFTGIVTRKLLLDLVQARIPLEMESVAAAARNATGAQIAEMRRLLTGASGDPSDDAALDAVNLAFHRQIAAASDNTVLAQILDVLGDLFTNEQRVIVEVVDSRARDHEDHLAILEAIERRDDGLAVERMRAHLERVREAVLRWNPDADQESAG